MTISQTWFRWSSVRVTLSMNFIFFQLKNARVFYSFPSPCCFFFANKAQLKPLVMYKRRTEPCNRPHHMAVPKFGFFFFHFTNSSTVLYRSLPRAHQTNVVFCYLALLLTREKISRKLLHNSLTFFKCIYELFIIRTYFIFLGLDSVVLKYI